MDNEGIGSWLERRIKMTPKNEALVFDGRAVTYEEMALRTRRLAHGLRALGVEKGDCVGFFGFNDPAALEVMFAAGCSVPRISRSTHASPPRKRVTCSAIHAAPQWSSVISRPTSRGSWLSRTPRSPPGSA